MDNDNTVDELALERTAKNLFGVAVAVDKIIARRIACGQNAQATFFLSKKRQLYCHIEGPARLVLGDVRKMAARMGVRAEMYMPPKGRPNYFDEIAREKFLDVYPGRHDIQPSDLVFYRTLAPYHPALLLISEVKNGVIYCADHDAHGGWRPAAKFAYRRIRTS